MSHIFDYFVIGGRIKQHNCNSVWASESFHRYNFHLYYKGNAYSYNNLLKSWCEFTYHYVGVEIDLTWVPLLDEDVPNAVRVLQLINS